MTKGTFGTPRPVGNVGEMRVKVVRLQFTGDEYELKVVVEEGNDVAGTLVEVESGSIGIPESALSAADQAAMNNFLRTVLSIYVDDKGYSGVVIS